MVIQPYGPEWRTGRRYMHEYFRRGVVDRYHSTQEREARKFLCRSLKNGKGRLDSYVVNQ